MNSEIFLPLFCHFIFFSFPFSSTCSKQTLSALEKKINYFTLLLIPVFVVRIYIPGHIEGTFEENMSEFGSDVTGTVIADVPGTYYVSIPGKEAIPVVITGTQNTFNFGILDVNPYTATVSIGESDNYAAQSNTTNFEVKAQLTPFSADSNKEEYAYGESITLSYGDLPNGGTDYRVQLTEGLSTFTALQMRGVPSEFFFLHEENHWVLKPSNSIKWYEEVLGWLDKYLDNE